MKNFQSLIFLAALIFTVSRVNAQSTDSLSAPKKLIINTSVLDYIGFNRLNTRCYNVGVEFYIKNRNSVYANIGSIYSDGSEGFFQINTKKTTGYRIQLERKHFIGKRKMEEPAILLFWPHILQYNSKASLNTGYYYSFGGSFQTTTTERNGYRIETGGITKTSSLVDKDYTVDRISAALNIKFGYQCIKKSGLVVDFCVGVGLNNVNTKANYPLEDSEVTPNRNDFLWFSRQPFDAQNGISPTILYQLKFGF